jgi:hypothetical protein
VEPKKPPLCVVSANTETGIPSLVRVFSAACSSLTCCMHVAASSAHCSPPTPPFLTEVLMALGPTLPRYLRANAVLV